MLKTSAAISLPAILGAALCTFLPSSTLAATYSDSYTVDPTSLVCGYYGSAELCGGGSYYSSPRMLAAGDTLTESVTYSAPVVVPGSKTQGQLYIGLWDGLAEGLALPGPYESTVQSTTTGYIGPPNPIVGPYTEGYKDGYVATVGFCCGYGVPERGFSVTGMTSQFSILTSDPNPIVATTWGYQVTLPATPKLLSSFPGGTVDSPTILPAGLIGQISSDISAPASDSQFYDFIWDGGLLQTRGVIVDANPLADFQFELFSVNGTTRTQLEDLDLSSTNAFSALMSLELTSGDYEIGMYTNSPYDPQFTITFDTPVGSFVPEPSSWALIILGVGAVGGALRRRSAAVSRAA
jgi:hypothetical protein